MSLKTLKELNAKLITTDNIERVWLSESELKQEAIKWIKHFENLLSKVEGRKKLSKKSKDMDKYYIIKQIVWIEYYFNINRKDLK